MRKSKVIPLEIAGKKEVTVKEVTPFAVYQALSSDNKFEGIVAIAENCTDLSREQLQGLYASEIEQLTDAFLEVNSSFLAVADKLGLKQPLSQIVRKMLDGVPALIDEMLKNYPPVFSALFKAAMEKMPGITAGDASSPPLKP